MVKRCFDFFCSLMGMMILLPLFLIIAFWIRKDSAGPVFFRQIRIGKNGVPFRIHKFRTMKVGSENRGQLTIGQDSRITRSGFFLRKYKLDELPQLIDVFAGKMSLVGPRPEVPAFVEFYPETVRKKILSVKPGITDMASIHMIDENRILAAYKEPQKAYVDVILPQKQGYYLKYVDDHSLKLDIKIIFLTIFKIFKNRDS
ncbi:MAG: sugar transferase [Tenuifilaceae bacterium]|nr:sugar transferase [Tenuifilaceae bacterium]